MNKKNWGIYLAILAGVSVTSLSAYFAHPVEPRLATYSFEAPRRADYSPGGAECSPTILAKIRGEKTAAAARSRCTEAAEAYRLQTNDLIQQTRAADSAQAQVALAFQMSWMTFLQTIGGLLTLIAAIAAAAYARDAARETRRAADVAQAGLQYSKEMSHLELRSYMEIGDVTISRRKDLDADNYSAFIVRCPIKNFGRTPALDISERIAWNIGKTKPSRDLYSVDISKCPSVAQDDCYAINEILALEKEEISSLGINKNLLQVIIEFEYSDVFGKRYRNEFYIRSPDLKETYWQGEGELVI